jgi:hypothetical protein
MIRQARLPLYATLTSRELRMISQAQRDVLEKQCIDDYNKYCDSLSCPDKHDPEHERYIETLIEFNRQNPNQRHGF